MKANPKKLVETVLLCLYIIREEKCFSTLKIPRACVVDSMVKFVQSNGSLTVVNKIPCL